MSILPVNAQNIPLIFEKFSSQNGLSQNTVTCFAQDRFGFIWIGTENGLNRFDAYGVKAYFESEHKQNGLLSGFITDISIDSANRVWIASANGLSYYNQKQEKFYHIRFKDKKLNPSVYINKIFIDSKNFLWIGSVYGLKRSKQPIDLQSDSINPEFMDFNNEIKGKNVVYIFEDKERDKWIATEKKLFRIEQNGNLKEIKFPEKLKLKSTYRITSIAEDKRMRFWIGTEQGLYWYNKQLNTFTDLRKHPFFISNPKANFIRDILVDQQGRVFIATYGMGLLLFSEENNSFITYRHESGNINSLAGNFTSCLFEDSSNTLFVSVIGSGFSKANLNIKKFYHYQNNPTKNKYIVRKLFVENNKTLWIGLQSLGLEKLVLEKNSFIHYNLPDKNNKNNYTVKAICRYDSTNILLGTFLHGILLFNEKTGKLKSFSLNNKQEQISYITDIKKDKANNIWISTFNNGIYFYNQKNKALKHYTAGNKEFPLINNSISSLYFDDEVLWIASLGGGATFVNLKTGASKTFYKNRQSNYNLPSNTVVDIKKDLSGNIWLGTSAGICRYIADKDSFEVFNIKNGLADEFINDIEVDKQDNIWFSTNKGITLLDKKSGKFINFGKKDGLQNDEYNACAGTTFPDGRIAFGGLNGLNIINPDSIHLNNYTPKVNIYKLLLFNQEVKVNQSFNEQKILEKSILLTKKIELNYNNNFIGFEFSAQDYQKPLLIQYEYMLEGFENEWNTTSALFRKANYTNLPPGKYIFKVRASNSDGFFSDNVKSIKIIIHPPFWKTSWFYILAVIIILAVFAFILYLSNKWIIAQNKKLEHLVEQRTLALEEKNIMLAEKMNYINKQNDDLKVFSTVVSEMKNTLLIMDKQGNFLFANKAFNETYMPLEEIEKKYGNNIFNMPFEDHILQIIKRCFNEKVSVQYEAEYTIFKDESFWVHSNLTPILDENEILKNVILIETDITEIKQREMQILQMAEELYKKADDLDLKNKELELKNQKITEQSQELKSLTENLENTNKTLEDVVQKRTKDLILAKEQAEKANQLKTTFLLNLSHEIRTPMNAICGFSELMADERSNIEKRKAYANIITENVESLLKLIDNIMDLSKMQAKQIELKPTVFKLKPVLEDIYYLYVVDDNHIKDNVIFNLDIDDAANINIKADIKHFRQVFINLIDNAVKYTEKGSISLEAKINKENNQLTISVKDTGIGIKKEEISNIFDYFRKVDDNIKLYRGTGLGLSIVREIINMHKWNIEVESTLNKGSTFKIIIPVEA